MSGNSWEVDSYREGKWKISVRNNPENDRVDEGDFPEGESYIRKDLSKARTAREVTVENDIQQ